MLTKAKSSTGDTFSCYSLITMHSMARANLNKSKKSLEFYYHSIKGHNQEAQNLHQLKFPLIDKSLSEVVILGSTNPQYDKIFFIELQVQYMKIASSKHVVYKNKKQFVYATCSEIAISMNNILSYCGLVDPRITTSDKDLSIRGNFN